MEEAFLHFVWKFQLFEHTALKSEAHQVIDIFEPGIKNSDAGPDFKNAKIRIGDITWNGNVEIHMKASDWIRHKHQQDRAYDNVILHVVWESDTEIRRLDGTVIPALKLANLVDQKLIHRYRELLVPEEEILCAKFFPSVNQISKYGMLDKALSRRLHTKSQSIFRDVGLTEQDWEEVAWRTLAQNFGFKTNADSLRELAKSVPVKILRKEAHQLINIESILFGQAGFLDVDPSDDYQSLLKQEYEFKRKKYGLKQRLSRHQWKFLRLRPANFPTLRIAQLAKLVSFQPNLFSLFVDAMGTTDLRKALKLQQSDYWNMHYDFGKKASAPLGKLGTSSIENILINTAVPLLFAYGIHKDDEELKERAIDLLSKLKAEKNGIISKWSRLGMKANSAFDSQALIEQYNHYCRKKKCLNCQIGADIIRTA